MRIAVLADIHGNLLAFEAALAHAKRQGFDQLVIAGDVIVGGPDSGQCWALARSLGCPIVRGNQERYASAYGTPDALPAWSTDQFLPIAYAVAQLSDADRAAMRLLPMSWAGVDPELLVVHGSVRSDRDSVTSYTPEPELAEMFPGDVPATIVRAHNHTAHTRVWGRRRIITSGSAGLALDGNPTSQYVMLTKTSDALLGGWEVCHHSVEYDLQRTLERFDETDYFRKTGPMGRLFYREFVTATQQIVPFVRLFALWSKQSPIALDAAVQRFLAI